MEFQRQCRRFLHYRTLNEETIKKNFGQITAMSSYKSSLKNSAVQNRIVFFDRDNCTIYVLNENDNQIIKDLKVSWISYGICCTNKPTNNFIYFTDHTNNKIRKFDENLNEIKVFTTPEDAKPINEPCGIAINFEFERIDVVDQKNHRVVSFDLKTDTFVSEMPLYDEVFVKKIKKPTVDLVLKNENFENEIFSYGKKKLINCWPFGIASKNERIFVTDWSRNFIYIYKNGNLENKICGHKLFTRIRDIVIDSLDSILVTDTYRKSIFVFDNRGVFLMETKVPIQDEEDTIYGVSKVDNTKLAFAMVSIVIFTYS